MVLEACRRHGVKRYVYASTVMMHSREGGFYRCSKHAAEQFVEEYQHRYGLDYTFFVMAPCMVRALISTMVCGAWSKRR